MFYTVVFPSKKMKHSLVALHEEGHVYIVAGVGGHGAFPTALPGRSHGMPSRRRLKRREKNNGPAKNLLFAAESLALLGQDGGRAKAGTPAARVDRESGAKVRLVPWLRTINAPSLVRKPVTDETVTRSPGYGAPPPPVSVVVPSVSFLIRFNSFSRSSTETPWEQRDSALKHNFRRRQ